ncbi:MAG TPA: class I SAM-dependent methyltransferase, partial [Usitatibacter sp.]
MTEKHATEAAANFRPASAAPMMTEEESQAWRPTLMGWSADILGFYRSIALELPNPCKVVEVGSAHGRSAIFLAQELLALGHGSATEIYMVDSWGGDWMVQCFPSIIKHATPKELELLHPVRATSKRASRMFEPGSISLLFIDGDHSRGACASDLFAWYHAVAYGGIVSGHDYDASGHPGVVAAVDTFTNGQGREVV